jgi:hypothetical protein
VNASRLLQASHKKQPLQRKSVLKKQGITNVEANNKAESKCKEKLRQQAFTLIHTQRASGEPHRAYYYNATDEDEDGRDAGLFCAPRLRR